MKTFNEYLTEGNDSVTKVEHVDKGLDSHRLILKKSGSLGVTLHQKHLNHLKKLGDGESSMFKDERNVTWHAKRDNGEYHLCATPSHKEHTLKFSKDHVK